MDLPLGRLGQMDWYIVKPLLAAGVALSLRPLRPFRRDPTTGAHDNGVTTKRRTAG